MDLGSNKFILVHEINCFHLWRKISQYEYIKSREYLKAMRNNYLKWVSYYREKGYRIHYQDDKWVIENINCTKIWKDMTADATERECRVPAGKRDLSIVCHV